MIVFDIDGTLSIVGDRLKYLNQDKKDWDSFYEACDEDKLNVPIARIAWIFLGLGYNVAYVTGRREGVRKKTIAWLNYHSLWMPHGRTKLYMRIDGDFRHDTIVKPELVQDFIHEIHMIFEDRASMVAKWRELGLTCLQVAEGNF